MYLDQLSQDERGIRILGEGILVDSQQLGQVGLGGNPQGQWPVAAVSEEFLVSAAAGGWETLLGENDHSTSRGIWINYPAR
ncbi:hypothetical protein [Streptomyces sp. NPDC050528]|uniref:hypothetical protein n=1 Tax=Streptomyces sp. NPDC050528 TaxID=3365623 RepID=UPI00378B08F3